MTAKDIPIKILSIDNDNLIEITISSQTRNKMLELYNQSCYSEQEFYKKTFSPDEWFKSIFTYITDITISEPYIIVYPNYKHKHITA